MLANYRCTEIKNKILNSHEKEIKDLIKQSSEQNMENIKGICIEIKNNICAEYEKQASNYVEKVYHLFKNSCEMNYKKNWLK